MESILNVPFPPHISGRNRVLIDNVKAAGFKELTGEKQDWLSKNGQDKLPGRLQRRYISKSRNAGPVNFIGWFGVGVHPASTLETVTMSFRTSVALLLACTTGWQ